MSADWANTIAQQRRDEGMRDVEVKSFTSKVYPYEQVWYVTYKTSAVYAKHPVEDRHV